MSVDHADDAEMLAQLDKLEQASVGLAYTHRHLGLPVMVLGLLPELRALVQLRSAKRDAPQSVAVARIPDAAVSDEVASAAGTPPETSADAGRLSRCAVEWVTRMGSGTKYCQTHDISFGADQEECPRAEHPSDCECSTCVFFAEDDCPKAAEATVSDEDVERALRLYRGYYAGAGRDAGLRRTAQRASGDDANRTTVKRQGYVRKLRAGEPNCDCGVGNAFYAHLHTPPCPLAEPWNAVPSAPNDTERLNKLERWGKLAANDPLVRVFAVSGHKEWTLREMLDALPDTPSEFPRPMPLPPASNSMDADG